ncbi:MAG: hypothetical protein A2X61_07470 [Ignavibacteria bacterium GWB2_35_12]|nr:MAG: hypothetical protein A2X63_12770 [Ignavibacteria bacterium GWA2_35_8]OGU39167.1 MAG: hypothetical protein A2X61_07470 [Ignavibacteria bacterium GWB2_35_12]OGU89195.1 MAG: hypothetical protein A2220_00860 [Ignavibacteria bacterium RIFOXYA2_FULL_35_10]OGV21033.1 MAG: hypothetical protein A2475_00760 [Ignavibacteria bacterium RIFOXYC2_FULL_35_21]
MKKAILILTFIVLYAGAFAQNPKQLTDTTESGWIDYGTYKLQKKVVGEYKYIKYSIDGNYIYTYSLDNVFRQWESETGLLVKEFVVPYDSVTYVCIDEEGKRLGIATREYGITAPVYMYDYVKDSLIYSVKAEHDWRYQGMVYYDLSKTTLRFNPQNNEFITAVSVEEDHGGIGWTSGFVNKWDKENGEFLSEFNSYSPFFIGYSNDGNILIISSYYFYWTSPSHGGESSSESSIILYDFNTSDTIELLNYENVFYDNNYIMLDISYDSKYLSATNGDSLLIWNLDTKNLEKQISWPSCNSIQYSRDNMYLITTSFTDGDNSVIRFYQIENKDLIDTIMIEGHNSLFIDTSPDSSKIACGLSNGSLMLFDLTKFLDVIETPSINNSKLIINPNLVSSSLSINYNVPSYSFVKLSVCDIFGNEIEKIVNEYLPEGNKETSFDASLLPDGINFIKLQAGSEQRVGKFIKLK